MVDRGARAAGQRQEQRERSAMRQHAVPVYNRAGAAVNPEPISPSPVRRDRGVALIVAYKLGKGGLWLVAAVATVVLMRLGRGDRLIGLAAHLRHHPPAWRSRSPTWWCGP